MTPQFADDDGRYELVSRIATGGMGQVWRARDTVLDRPVAVKVLKPEYADDLLFRRRFEIEARHAGSLHHPGIASVYDFGEAAPTDGSGTPRPYLVMELVDGQPLSALLRPGTPMDPEVARDLLAQAATALGAAHAQGLVHRDVKPANLIVTEDRAIKITDFGIARAAEGMALTETGQVLGTPAYISPEQAEGHRATPASDVYSLAVVAFESLTGHKPFTGDTPVAMAIAHVRQPVPPLGPDVPADLAAVVSRGLSKDPGDRFTDGTEFARALRDPSSIEPMGTSTQVLSAAPPSQGPSPMPVAAPVADSAGAPHARRSYTGWLVVLAIVVLAAVLIAFWLGSRAGDDPNDPAPSPSDSPSETPSDSPSETPTETPTETETRTESPTESPTETPTETPTPATVDVDPADYVGRDVGDVEGDLRALGLVPERIEVTNPGTEAAGTVTDVQPSGALSEGDSVQVSFWGEPPATSDQTEGEGDQS